MYKEFSIYKAKNGNLIFLFLRTRKKNNKIVKKKKETTTKIQLSKPFKYICVKIPFLLNHGFQPFLSTIFGDSIEFCSHYCYFQNALLSKLVSYTISNWLFRIQSWILPWILYYTPQHFSFTIIPSFSFHLLFFFTFLFFYFFIFAIHHHPHFFTRVSEFLLHLSSPHILKDPPTETSPTIGLLSKGTIDFESYFFYFKAQLYVHHLNWNFK